MEPGDDYKITADTFHDGMRHISAVPSPMVCSVGIELDLDGEGKIHDLRYERGCNGNLQGIKSLVKGMKIDDVIEKLSGIKCGNKPTSCPDQLANCLSKFKAKI